MVGPKPLLVQLDPMAGISRISSVAVFFIQIIHIVMFFNTYGVFFVVYFLIQKYFTNEKLRLFANQAKFQISVSNQYDVLAV